jgi:hypothetical protein
MEKGAVFEAWGMDTLGHFDRCLGYGGVGGDSVRASFE